MLDSGKIQFLLVVCENPFLQHNESWYETMETLYSIVTILSPLSHS